MASITREMADVNGTSLYYERRGTGPSVVLITGATGDAAWYEEAAGILSDEFSVITYDRRANSRSPRPSGWTSTSIREQADDAAALVEALGIGPAAVFGSSGGAVIALALLEHHPDTVRGVVLHEPPLIAVTSDPGGVMAALQAAVGTHMASGGPAAAMEAFARGAAGDEVIDAFAEDVRRRLFANGEVFFGIELDAFASWMPADETLREHTVPLFVAAGRDNAAPSSPNHYLHEASVWTAERAGTELIETTGAHVPYASDPQTFCDELRPTLRKVS